MVLRIHMEILVLTTFKILLGVEVTTPKRSRQTKCVVDVVVEINPAMAIQLRHLRRPLLLLMKAVARTLTMVLRISMEMDVLAILKILIGVEITTPKRSRQTKCVVRVVVAVRTTLPRSRGGTLRPARAHTMMNRSRSSMRNFDVHQHLMLGPLV